MDSIEINGKKFEYASITLGKGQKIGEFLASYADKKYSNKKTWYKVIRFAFKMGFLWDYLHIVPKQLRYNNIPMGQAGEIQAGFFELCKGTLSEQTERLKSFTSSNQNNTV